MRSRTHKSRLTHTQALISTRILTPTAIRRERVVGEQLEDGLEFEYEHSHTHITPMTKPSPGNPCAGARTKANTRTQTHVHMHVHHESLYKHTHTHDTHSNLTREGSSHHRSRAGLSLGSHWKMGWSLSTRKRMRRCGAPRRKSVRYGFWFC